MRLCGDVPAGAFFAHAGTADGGTLVVGCCRGGQAVEALAAAQQARRLIERCDSADAVARVLAQLRAIHGFDALESVDWKRGDAGEPRLLAVADTTTTERARAWCRASEGSAPADR